MPYFKIIYQRDNRRQQAIVKAKSRADAMREFIEAKRGIPINAIEVPKPLKEIFKDLDEKFQNLTENSRVHSDAYISTLRQIGAMTDAGIPINTAIQEAINFTNDHHIKRIFTHILQDIEKGKRFSEASKPFAKELGQLSIAMFELGDKTGEFSNSLLDLANIIEQIETNRRKLKKATLYPVIVMVTMFIAFGIVITMVVPQFQELFLESQLELPYPTKLLIWIEQAISRYGLFIISGAMILSTIYGILYYNSEEVRLLNDKFLLRVYIIGSVIRYAMLERFFYVLHIQIRAGIPIIDALENALTIVENRWLKYNIKKISLSIREGKSLSEGFKRSEVFDPIIIQMIKTGEDSGVLDKMVQKSSRYYGERYQYIIDNIATLIEPLLIAGIAGFVLILALGIFLPMWNMVEMAG